MKNLIILFLFFALCGTGFFGYEQFKAVEEAKVKEEARQAKIKADKNAISTLQKGHIDGFKTDLKKAAKDYKDYIQVMSEIVKPQNFASEEYTSENYKLFRNDIAPLIRQKADALLNVFTRYRKQLNKLVDENSTDIEKKFLNEWQEMHDVQLERSINLLTQDDKLIEAYSNLIEFYYVHSKLYSVDVEAEMFDFKREKDEERHKGLLKAIRDIRRDKATMRRKE